MTSIVGVPLIVVVLLVGTIAVLFLLLVRRARAERVLRASEERWRLMLDRAPVMMWTARPDTTLDYLNRTIAEFTGHPLEQLAGNGWLDSVHPEDLDRCLATYMPAFEARRPFLLEYRLRHADGRYRWLMASGVPKYGPDGAFAGYIGCDIDISERKRAEESVRESQAALEVSHREIQDLAGRLIEAQDAERARIARDLHDDVSQQLAGVSIAFSSLKQRLGEYHIDEELRQELTDLQQQTLTLARSLRQLSHDLHPDRAAASGARQGPDVVLRRARACTRCGDDVQRGGRLRKHHAGRCPVHVPDRAGSAAKRHRTRRRQPCGCATGPVRRAWRRSRSRMMAGDSTSPAALERGKGLGLVSISERARIAGGTVSIESGPRQGTRVRARIPANARVKVDVGSGPRWARSQRRIDRCAATPFSSPTTTRLSPTAWPGCSRKRTSTSSARFATGSR